ncbi:MAG: 2-C-methyl-D-erythritol 2,4-cyclodiphosphate synthase, partial [Bacteroidota bacterium]|nr:2-C-methyl-D-erythritol 2,4-cyclodiphosphate synthase [Bacteroidota bacterium]
VRAKNYQIVNIDSTVCLEAPRIMTYAGEMRKVISQILGLSPEDISIKATTTEGLGFVGRGEGLVAYVTVLLQSVAKPSTRSL